MPFKTVQINFEPSSLLEDDNSSNSDISQCSNQSVLKVNALNRSIGRISANNEKMSLNCMINKKNIDSLNASSIRDADSFCGIESIKKINFGLEGNSSGSRERASSNNYDSLPSISCETHDISVNAEVYHSAKQFKNDGVSDTGANYGRKNRRSAEIVEVS